MSKEAKYNPEGERGNYSHTIHHGEVVSVAKVKNDAPTAYKQNLAASKGTNAAKQSLIGRYKSHDFGKSPRPNSTNNS